MGRMPMQKVDHTHRTVLGPCPGCYIWTLEYDLSDPPLGYGGVTEDLLEAVESALQDHLDECPGLQEIVRTLL